MNSEFASYIPEFCTNISDFGIYTNRGITDIFTETRFLALESQISALNEYSNDHIINESMKDKLKEIGRKIKEGFLKMLGAIKEFFAKIATFIKNLFTKMKKEIFSNLSEKDFKAAVDYFDKYDGIEIDFSAANKITDSNNNDKNIYFGTKEFIKSADEYNKKILDRSKTAYNTLSDFYTKAGASTKIGIWLGKQIHDKEEAIKELKTSKSKQIYGYILFNKEYDNSISDSFGKEEVEATIYSELSKTSFLRTPITSNNIKNFAKDIADSVYGNEIQNKWVGITRDEYDNLKNIIETAIKDAEKYTFYTSDSDFAKDMNDRVEKLSGSSFGAIGPSYALDFAARCKDIVTVLTSVTSVMNGMVNNIYKKNITLVIHIINQYYNMSKQKKELFHPDDIDTIKIDNIRPQYT